MESPITIPTSGAKLFVCFLFSMIVIIFPSITNIIAALNTERLKVELKGMSVIKTIMVA